MLTLQEIAACLQIETTGPAVVIQQVEIDSRKLTKGSLFVAIQGDNFDGHDYVAAAWEQGAVAALVERQVDCPIPQLIVPNTLTALAELSRFWRRRFDIPVVALTGSAGKTTVKEMAASVLKQWGNTYVTQGNYNNHIGAPLSILQLRPSATAAVFELGTNQKGDIALTTACVQPTIAFIHNIYPAHLAGLGDERGVLVAKSEIFQALDPAGKVLINQDAKFADEIAANMQGFQQLRYGESDEADVQARQIRSWQTGYYAFDCYYEGNSVTIKLPVPGRHQVSNALAACAVAIAIHGFDARMATGIASFETVQQRQRIIQLPANVQVIDDTYNAHLGSVEAAIRLLAEYSGRRILVMGDMAECGPSAAAMHRQLGQLAAEHGIDSVYSFGDLSQAIHDEYRGDGQHFTNKADLIAFLQANLHDNTTILVKGSRAAKMEEVVAALA